MRKVRSAFWLTGFTLLLIVTAACTVPETITISGLVETKDGHPLAEASVAYESLANPDDAGVVMADEAGRFTITNTVGPVKLRVTLDGWQFPDELPVISESRGDLQVIGTIKPRFVHELAYYDLMLGAVTIDMAKWIGWLWDNTAAVETAAEENRLRLHAVIGQLEALALPDPSLDDARQALLASAFALDNLYAGIQDKTLVDVQMEADESETHYERYWAVMSRYAADWTTDWQPQPAFATNYQSLYYQRAKRRMEVGNYLGALDVLEMLLDLVPTSSTERHFVLLRAVDALGPLRYAEGNPEHSETMLAYLTEILESRYSPLFYEAYVRWRTTAQTFLYGMDNASPIPNWDFNRVRRDLIEKLWQSDTVAAEKQIQQLLLLDNITRGTLQGNSNVMWETELFMP